MTLRTRRLAQEGADHWIQTWQKALQDFVGPNLVSTQWEKTYPFWGLGLASLGLTLINGPLVISLGVGLVVYQQLVNLTPEQWQQLRQSIQKRSHASLSTQGKTLLLTGTALAATYLTTSIWAETHHLWVALALGSQSLVTLALLVWLLRSSHTNNQSDAPTQLRRAEVDAEGIESLLLELNHPNPLRRLVLVRQLTRLAGQEPPEHSYIDGGVVSVRSHLIDCFHLMLAQESEPLVRTALREGLQHLRPPAQLPEGAPPLPSPQKLQPTNRVRRPVVEYIEP
ncbi:MAG TPA: hypothetical protein V6D29_23435 [Leptolyngbyaceae cyanobacterium]